MKRRPNLPPSSRRKRRVFLCAVYGACLMFSAGLRPLLKPCRSICGAFKAKRLGCRGFRMESRMTLMKAILGLCLGLGPMAVLQTVGVWSLQEHIKSQSNVGLPIGNTPVIGNFDADALKNGIL